MLVVSRRDGQTVVVWTSDGPVTVMLVESRPGSARIGIDAPPEVQIVRDDAKKCGSRAEGGGRKAEESAA